jgi:hypothetical protein
MLRAVFIADYLGDDLNLEFIIPLSKCSNIQSWGAFNKDAMISSKSGCGRSL